MALGYEDDADNTFIDSRRAEKKDTVDALTEKALQSQENDPIRQARARAQDLLAKQQMDAEAAEAEEAPAAPAAPTETSDENGPTLSQTASDVRNSAIRGPVADGADTLDNVTSLLEGPINTLQGLMNDAGIPSVGLRDLMGEDGVPAKARDLVDANLGTPETLAGELTQGVTGQLAFLIPALRAFKGAGLAGKAGVAAGVAGATQGEGEGNLSNLMTEAGEGTFFDNFITRGLAIDEDDSTFERITKTAVEDMAIGFVADKTVAKLVEGWTASRTSAKSRPAITSAAARSGVEMPQDITEGLDAVAAARQKVDLLEVAHEELVGGRKAFAEVAAYSDEVAENMEAGLGLAAKLDVDTEQVTSKVAAELEAAKGELADAQASLKSFSEATEADGRVLEAVRQESKGLLDGDVDAALGTAATRNMPEFIEPPKKITLGNYLEADEDTARLIADAVKNDDIAGLQESFGKIYDNTNFNRMADDGGIENLLTANATIYGRAANSTRLQKTVGLAQTEEDARALMTQLAEDAGGDIDQMTGALAQLMPDVTDLRTQFNALRMTEVGIATKVQDLLGDFGTDAWSTASDAEFIRWATLLANVNDMRSGIIGEIAGTLGANRIKVDGGGFADILQSARVARDENLQAIVQRGGGTERVRKLASVMQMAARNGTDSLIASSNNIVDSFTLGDIAYESFIMNILSGPATQAVNLSSNAIVGTLWAPTSRTFEAGAMAVIRQDLTGFKALRGYIEGMASGATGALRFNAKLVPDLSNAPAVEGVVGKSLRALQGNSLFQRIRGTQVGEAFAQGRRQTGSPGQGLYTEAIPDRSLINAKSFGSLFRRGVPLAMPFRSFIAGAPDHLNLAGFIPQGTRNRIADFAGTVGPLAQAVDYTGRVMSWPGRSLAAGDELFAAMSYRAEVYSSSVEHAVAKGLEGDDLVREVARLRRQVGNINQLRKRTNPRNPATVARMTELDGIHDQALKWSDKQTFVTKGAAINDKVEALRSAVPGVRWFAPFIKTPINLAAQGVTDYSPLGPAVSAIFNAAQGNPDETAKAVGRLAMTGGLFAGVWGLVTSGRLTGGHPHNTAQRDIAKTAGLPYTLEIGGERVGINRFDPLFMPIAIMADLVALQGRPGADVDEKLQQKMIGLVMEAFKSRTFMQGMSELMDVLENPSSAHAERLIVSKIANTIVPNSRLFAALDKGGLPVPDDLVVPQEDDGTPIQLFKDFVRGDKSRQRPEATKGFGVHLLSTVHADLPAGLSDGFAAFWNEILSEENQLGETPYRDFFGEVANTPPGAGPDFLSPMPQVPVGEDPVSDELTRLGYGFAIKQRFGQLDGVNLDNKQRDRFHRYFAKPTPDTMSIREALESLMLDEDGNLSEQWQILGDPVGQNRGGRLEAVDAVVGRYMGAAQDQMRANDPRILQAFIQLQTEKLSDTQETAEQAAEVRRNPLLNALDN